MNCLSHKEHKGHKDFMLFVGKNKVGISMKRLLFGFLLLAFATHAQEGESLVVRRKPSEMPKLASSADGFVEVVAADVPGDPMGFRLPILGFATRSIRELERVYKLEMPRRDEAGLAIHALDGRTNDTRVVARAFRRETGLVTRIWLPSPGYSDIDLLRFEIAKAYFASWIERAAPKGTVPGTLPDWFVQGALRAADAQTVHDDVRFVLKLWSSARLPFFSALCTDLRVAKGPAAALPGYVVSYVREKHLFKPVLERLASGLAWDGAWLAEQLTGESDPVQQDRASDERLSRLARAVLSPGLASDWDVQVFASRLWLYPAGRGAAPGRAYSFAESVPLAATNVQLRAAAAKKALDMPRYVLGRGETMMEAGEAYRQFLLAVARGGEPDELSPLLKKADDILGALLAR